MFLTKVGVLNWYSSMKIFFRKIQTIFDVEKWLWKSEICNFVTLSPLSEKVQKFFQCNFCDSISISFIVKSFHKIMLTWWNAYNSNTLYSLIHLSYYPFLHKKSIKDYFKKCIAQFLLDNFISIFSLSWKYQTNFQANLIMKLLKTEELKL